MPLKVWNGSGFVTAQNTKVWDGSNWLESCPHVWDGTKWIDCLSSIDLSTIDSTYTLLYQNDQPDVGFGQGHLQYFFDPNNGTHQVTEQTSISSQTTLASDNWVTPVVSKCISNYEIRATGSNINTGDSLNTWYDLATSGLLIWGVLANQPDEFFGTLNIQLRRKGTTTVISEANISLNVSGL
jgi:hypothetical protein